MPEGPGATATRASNGRSTWAAYATCVCALVYAAKGDVVVLVAGVVGDRGTTGKTYAAFGGHVDFHRQLGLVTVDVVAGFIPRWMLLTALGIGFAALAAGALAVVQNALFGPEPMDWASVLLTGFAAVWSALWGATA